MICDLTGKNKMGHHTEKKIRFKFKFIDNTYISCVLRAESRGMERERKKGAEQKESDRVQSYP